MFNYLSVQLLLVDGSMSEVCFNIHWILYSCLHYGRKELRTTYIVIIFVLKEELLTTCTQPFYRNDGTCLDPPMTTDVKSRGVGGNFLNMKMTPTKSKGFGKSDIYI